MRHATVPLGLVIACALWATGAAAGRATIAVRADARALQPGEMVVLTLTTSEPVGAVHVRVFDRTEPAYRVDATTWRALVGIDLDTAARTYTAAITADGPSAQTAYAIRVRPKAFPTRRLTVDEAFVNPPADVQARITDEAKALAALWTASAPDRLWTGPFLRPVPQPANSAFGSRSVLNGSPRSPHGGADFAAPAGTPVAAPNAGRVVLAQPLYYTGNTVVIDHGLGVLSLFAHLSTVKVTVGDQVQPGQIVGTVGSTGRVTGPHLHWALRVNGARVDPLSLLAVLGR
jgi:murein DD-endopeptidase MepM/ murein hydrolase activator NlpD